MKPIPLFLTALLLSACKQAPEKVTNTQEQTVSTTVNTPHVTQNEMTQNEVFTLGKDTYKIQLHRIPDTTLPIVKDENEEKFYDNSVDVDIHLNNQPLLHQRFTKADFKDFIPDHEYNINILQGMSVITSAQKALQLTAEIGEPGMAGEGRNFVVTVHRNGQTEIHKFIPTNLRNDEE